MKKILAVMLALSALLVFAACTATDETKVMTYEEYVALNAEIIKVSVGKGIISFEEFIKIIDIEVKGN